MTYMSETLRINLKDSIPKGVVRTNTFEEK